MNEMIERVARALCKKAGDDPDRHFVDRLGHTRDYPWWQSRVDDARAAIEAMLDPIDAQLLAGAKKELPAIFKHGLEGLPTDGKSTREGMARVVGEVRETYRAMIAAALAEEPKP